MMRIFFIYDTAYCKAEEDDPKDAVLYFFPTQTTNQCYSLCGQIVGVSKFFRATFSSPSLIVLDQEKFALHWSGKYLFVLGGSPDIHGNVLKRQLQFLCGMFCFYHGSITNLMKTCKNNRKEFLIKMELAWSRYITLAQCYNNLLQLPVHALPLALVKKHAEAIAKANQLLHMCQMSSSVIAGAVFCNCRVLSSQLTPEMSSYLTLMSNENAAYPVRNVTVPNQNLPPDVELKYVYLSQKVIQGIVKYNHLRVGNSVRVKDTEKPHRTHSLCESLSSGSEGDVDSGNCTEIGHNSKGACGSSMKRTKPSYFELNFKTQLVCCPMHSTVFKKDLLKSKNRTFLKYINSEYICEKLKMFRKKAFAHLSVGTKSKKKQKMEKKMKNDQVPSFNLLCHHHAAIFSTTFVSKSTYEHTDLSSVCDLEYSCHFCINHQFSSNIFPQSLKSWNSDMQIPEYLEHIPLKPCVLENNAAKTKLKNVKSSKYKIQILKCRIKNDNATQHADTQKFHPHHVQKPSGDNVEMLNAKSKTSKAPSVYHVPQSLFESGRYWEKIENNNLEKSVLYVQRCGTNMLLLLLNKNYDENILTYLWNCGFAFLQDLDHTADKKVEEGNDVDPMHHILMYDNVQKVLKEHPHNHCSVVTEKHVRESLQAFKEDFHSNPKLHMVSLLSTYQSIYACQTRQNFAFYLQHDQNSRKSESLCNLSKKAVRRLEKYMKFST